MKLAQSRLQVELAKVVVHVQTGPADPSSL